jgi:hypothetical protein
MMPYLVVFGIKPCNLCHELKLLTQVKPQLTQKHSSILPRRVCPGVYADHICSHIICSLRHLLLLANCSKIRHSFGEAWAVVYGRDWWAIFKLRDGLEVREILPLGIWFPVFHLIYKWDADLARLQPLGRKISRMGLREEQLDR